VSVAVKEAEITATVIIERVDGEALGCKYFLSVS